jgi:hypothetical protein
VHMSAHASALFGDTFATITMPKRKYSRATSRTKRRSVKGYAKAKRAIVRRKQRRVVKRVKSARIRHMPFLGMPPKKVIKMAHTTVENFYFKNNLPVDAQGNPITTEFGEKAWDTTNPIAAACNNIYDPPHTKIFPTADHVRGFAEVSQHYSSWKVIGAKVTFKVRRIGPQNRWQDLDDGNPGTHTHVEELHTLNIDTTQQPWTQSGDTQRPVPMTPAELGTPDAGDHMLVTLINRTWQQDNVSALQGNAGWVTQYNPQSYKTLMENKDLKGVRYRELRPGVGRQVTMTHKWRPATNLSRTDADLQTGHFFRDKLAVGDINFNTGANGPQVARVDAVHLNIIPFDPQTNNLRDATFTQRFMVTRDIEYLVLCYDKKVQNLN